MLSKPHNPGFLTKTQYKRSLGCPTKLYYSVQPEFANISLKDARARFFIIEGCKVEILVKLHYKHKYTEDCFNLRYESTQDALKHVNELLKRDFVIVFEAPFLYKDLFARVDVLIKDGDKIQLIEIKSKSRDSRKHSSKNNYGILDRKKMPNTDWLPYIEDIAFQKYVIGKIFPERELESYLMVLDKSVECPTDGLNQKFQTKCPKTGSISSNVVLKGRITPEDLTPQMMMQIPVDAYISDVMNREIDGKSWEERLHLTLEAHKDGTRIDSPITAECGDCEFREACWSKKIDNGEIDIPDIEDFEKSSFKLWNWRNRARALRISMYTMSDLYENPDYIKKDFDMEEYLERIHNKKSLKQSQRQFLQCLKSVNGDTLPYFAIVDLIMIMGKWIFPLIFIDFETISAGIPYYKGLKPYEPILFQFSVHIVWEDGRVSHYAEYINLESDIDPSIASVIHLLSVIPDEGTILHYAYHEKTILRNISSRSSDEEFKKQIHNLIERMVDMKELIKDCTYFPETHGSNSIKNILPAMLNSSTYLQNKYSNPIYGASEGIGEIEGIPSKNYRDWQWIHRTPDGQITNPYELLTISSDSEIEIDNGVGAMIAYEHLQRSRLSESSKSDEIRGSLLKYCELDTLAMVMIYEGLREIVKADL